MRTLTRITAAAALIALLTAPAAGQSLRGSSSSVDRQYRTAHDHDFTFLRTSTAIHDFAAKGYLVKLEGNGNYTLAKVSYPYARPEVKVFVERLALQYRAACGEPLVITSLTRPQNSQPRNASKRSVHPTGMAVDLRRSTNPGCRAWLEGVLLDLEKRRVIEATRENYPPHYHVAVFPKPYARYVAAVGDPQVPDPSEVVRHRVRRGDSLWSIARNYGIDVDSLRQANRLDGNRIYAGQTLQIPTSGK